MTRLTPFEQEGLPVLKKWTRVREHAAGIFAGFSYGIALLLTPWVALTQQLSWGIWAWGITVLLLVATIVLQDLSRRWRAKKDRRIVALEEDKDDLRAQIAQLEDRAERGADKRRAAIGEKAHSLLDELEILNPDTRITVYQHEPERETFVSISRVSDNPKWQKSGRAEYPDDQGLIAEAWHGGRATKFELSSDPEAWAEEVSMTGIPLDDAAKIAMKSLSYVGIRLDYGTRQVGVLMLEGTKPRSVTSRNADKVQQSTAYRELAAMLAVTPKLPPRAAQEDGEEPKPAFSTQVSEG